MGVSDQEEQSLSLNTQKNNNDNAIRKMIKNKEPAPRQAA